MRKFRILIVPIFILIVSNTCIGQITARLTLTSGGAIPFNINSLTKYQSGITYTEYTKFDIYFDDPSAAVNWEFVFRANTATIVGDGGNNLNLNYIEVTAVDGGGSSSATYTGTQFLTNGDVELVNTGPEGDETVNKVNITWECGVTNPLFGEPPDYYTVDVIFTLQEDF